MHAMTIKRQRNTVAVGEVRIGDTVEKLPLADLDDDVLRACDPIREFRWRKGQAHFPGWYWSVTERDLVMYESRLELARLRLADFDPDVRVIRSQPFRMTYVDADGKRRRHVPDFALILMDARIRIVNVKPADRLTVPKVAQTLASAHAALGQHGFETEIWSGDDPTAMAALQFIGGFRNPALFDAAQVQAARGALKGPMPVSEAEQRLSRLGVAQPRAVLLHLLWTRHLLADLTQPLEPATLLEAG